MPLGKVVGPCPGHIVLDGDPVGTQSPTAAPPHFRPMRIVAKRSPISATAENLYIWSPKNGSTYHITLVCPICDGVLWPNGWMDQDAIWYGCSPRPRPHCVRWGPSSAQKRGHSSPQFSACVYCGQTARWIKIRCNLVWR